MLQWIRIDQLVVDPRYQRPIYGAGARNVRRIAEQFRWSRFAPIIVAPIEGGVFAVIDGQHRATAAALVGVESVPAQVVIAELDEQARAFTAINAGATRVSALTIQAAGVEAGDTVAAEIAEVARAGGVVLLTYPKAAGSIAAGETMAIGTIRSSIRAYGRETVITALSCITDTNNNTPGACSALAIKALCAVLGGNAVWRDAGARLLEAFDAIDLEGEIDEARVARRPRATAVWEVLADRLRDRLADRLDRRRAA